MRNLIALLVALAVVEAAYASHHHHHHHHTHKGCQEKYSYEVPGMVWNGYIARGRHGDRRTIHCNFLGSPAVVTCQNGRWVNATCPRFQYTNLCGTQHVMYGVASPKVSRSLAAHFCANTPYYVRDDYHMVTADDAARLTQLGCMKWRAHPKKVWSGADCSGNDCPGFTVSGKYRDSRVPMKMEPTTIQKDDEDVTFICIRNTGTPERTRYSPPAPSS